MESIAKAVEIRRQLATKDPAGVEPDLAASLYNLSIYLADSGDHANALVAIREVVAILRRLVETDPRRFTPHLERSLERAMARSW